VFTARYEFNILYYAVVMSVQPLQLSHSPPPLESLNMTREANIQNSV